MHCPMTVIKCEHQMVSSLDNGPRNIRAPRIDVTPKNRALNPKSCEDSNFLPGYRINVHLTNSGCAEAWVRGGCRPMLSALLGV